MTSLVDTSVKYFSSLMANPPLLNGVPGSGIALLDACLKDGFDTKSVTIVVAGGVATVSWTGTHSCLRSTVVEIAGVTGSLTALNGEQRVASKPSPTSCTFATAAADGTATGNITMKMAPLGWAKRFTGNVAAYQSQAVLSPKHLLRVDDTNATFMRVVGYESMSDVDNGLGAFPTSAQVSGGGFWPKRQSASATGVPWMLFGDGRIFFILLCPYGPSPTAFTFNSTLRAFGDPIALKPSGDAYATILNVSVTNSVASMQDGDILAPTIASTYMPRSYSGNGTGVQGYSQAYCGGVNVSGMTATVGVFPNGIDGALYLSKKTITLTNDNSNPRSELPGVRHIPQSGVYGQFIAGDIWPGTGADAGRDFVVVPSANTSLSAGVQSGGTGYAMIDVTGPWR